MTTSINKLLLLAFALSFQPLLWAQQHEIDSIKAKLPTLAQDTNRVIALNDLSYKVMFTSPHEGELYAEESVRLAKDLNFSKGVANAYVMMGISHDLRGNFMLAIAAYEKGLRALEGPQLTSGQTHIALLNGLGLAYSRMADYPKALDCFLRSLQSAEREGNTVAVINILLNIGLVYYDQKDYDRAFEFYGKCKDQAAAAGRKDIVAKADGNIGLIYRDQGKYSEAIRYFLNSLKEKRLQNDVLGVSKSLNNLGGVYKDIGDYATSLRYLDEAEQLKHQVGDKWGLIDVSDTRAAIYLEQHKTDAAEKLIRTNLRLVNEINGANKELVYQRFHDLYVKKNDYKNALAWYVRKTAYRDSVFNDNKSRQLAELQTFYEVNKKEKEILQLEKDREAAHFARNTTIVLLLALSAISICVFAFLRSRATKKQQLFEIELELQQKELENARLREEELGREIEFKNKELASYTINFVQKSELMEDLKRNLQTLDPSDPNIARKITGINRIVENSYQVDREWEDFKVQFENVHRNFFRILKDHCPELTNGDLKLCALLKLNMNMKEAARVLGISPESVKTARYRLRKKFGLSQDDNLVDFILNIENEIPFREGMMMPG